MQTINLRDHGILPGTDITLSLHALLLAHPTDATFVFEDGDYYFAPHTEMHADYRISNSDVIPHRVLGIWMQNMRNCALVGNGARLLFAGHMQPVTMDHCTGIRMVGFAIDWPKPLVAEGEVVAVGDGYADLYVDPAAFPHRYVNNWLEFDVGNDEWYPLGRHSQIQFDGSNRCVTRASGDNFSPARIEALGGDVYRVWPKKRAQVAVGNIFVLRHNARIHAGIFTEKCADATFEDITVHSCGGLGCLAQFCRDITYRRVNFLPNRARGRRIANGRDDGMHLTCNSGTMTVTECSFVGLMDDPINIHGCCVTADEVVDAYTLRCRYRHNQAQGFRYWAEPGDEIGFIERRHMTPAGAVRVAAYTLEAMDTFTLTFDAPLTDEIIALAKAGDMLALDNLTHTAAFVCTKNRFGSCRARGVLVSTPKPVRISDNYFASSGAAVLLAGDSNYWFESGACRDVEISRNVFTDVCLSSPYQHCDGVIDLSPVVPEPDAARPFHRNVRITHNTFDTADTPVLHAYSCADLTFTGNRMFKSPGADRWHKGDAAIRLDHCSGVDLRGNDWIGDFGFAQHVAAVDCADVTQG